MLLASNCWVAFLRRLSDGRRVGFWLPAAYAVCGLACCYLHHFGAGLALLLGGGAVVLARGRSRWAAAAVLVLLAAGYAPGLWFLALQKRHAHSWDWIPPPGLYSIGWYLKFLFNDSRTLPALAVALGVLALIRVALARRGRKTAARFAERPIAGHSPSLLLAIWLVVPFAGAVAVSYLAFPLLTNRNLIVGLPAAYLLLARAFKVLASGLRLALLAGLTLAFLLWHLLFVVRFYRVPEKEQFRAAVATVVASDPAPDPRVVVLGRAFHPEYFDHYFARLGSRRRVDLMAGDDESLPATRAFLDRARPRRVWLLRGHREVTPAFLAFLRGRYGEREHEALLGADVWRFEAARITAR